MARVKRTLAQVLEAIKDSGGNLSEIARRLNVSRLTVAHYAERWAKVKEAIEEEDSKITDRAVLNIVEQINAGDPNWSKWWLTHRDARFKNSISVDQTITDKPVIGIEVVNPE